MPAGAKWGIREDFVRRSHPRARARRLERSAPRADRHLHDSRDPLADRCGGRAWPRRNGRHPGLRESRQPHRRHSRPAVALPDIRRRFEPANRRAVDEHDPGCEAGRRDRLDAGPGNHRDDALLQRRPRALRPDAAGVSGKRKLGVRDAAAGLARRVGDVPLHAATRVDEGRAPAYQRRIGSGQREGDRRGAGRAREQVDRVDDAAAVQRPRHQHRSTSQRDQVQRRAGPVRLGDRRPVRHRAAQPRRRRRRLAALHRRDEHRAGVHRALQAVRSEVGAVDRVSELRQARPRPEGSAQGDDRRVLLHARSGRAAARCGPRVRLG